jgi:hypothetical protein
VPEQFTITESQQHTSAQHVGHVAVVGRDTQGSITLRMTPAAAETLAAILTRYDALHGLLTGDYQAAGFDGDLWVHVGVDLLAQKAMQLSVGLVDELTALVPAVDVPPPASGYLPPRARRGHPEPAATTPPGMTRVSVTGHDVGPGPLGNHAVRPTPTIDAVTLRHLAANGGH